MKLLIFILAAILTSCAPPADGPDPLDWDRKFAEMLVFTGTMTTTDRDAVEAYLTAKWI